jgi:hypothetical protein
MRLRRGGGCRRDAVVAGVRRRQEGHCPGAALVAGARGVGRRRRRPPFLCSPVRRRAVVAEAPRTRRP